MFSKFNFKAFSSLLHFGTSPTVMTEKIELLFPGRHPLVFRVLSGAPNGQNFQLPPFFTRLYGEGKRAAISKLTYIWTPSCILYSSTSQKLPVQNKKGPKSANSKLERAKSCRYKIFAMKNKKFLPELYKWLPSGKNVCWLYITHIPQSDIFLLVQCSPCTKLE